jgi:hypothetical protein
MQGRNPSAREGEDIWQKAPFLGVKMPSCKIDMINIFPQCDKSRGLGGRVPF